MTPKLLYYRLIVLAFVSLASCNDSSVDPAKGVNKSQITDSTSQTERLGDVVPSKIDRQFEDDNVKIVSSAFENQPSDEDSDLKISFCGIRTQNNIQFFKIYDWDRGTEEWLPLGSMYQGFQIVGIDESTDALILSKSGYWYLYQLENMKLSSSSTTGSRPRVILSSDIPDGLSVMDYILNNTEPLNSSEMQVDDVPLNSGEGM